MTTLRFVLPPDVDDPARPSGGNRYDRKVIGALRERGWTVTEQHEHPRDVADGGVVVVDALVGLREPDRYRGAVVLLHMPFAQSQPGWRTAERALLHAAAEIVTTSYWTREWVVTHYGLDPSHVMVARPGVDPSPSTTASSAGERLLCVGAVTRLKGYDVVLAALERVADLAWTCVVAGALDLEPSFVEALRRSPAAERVTFAGPLPAPPYEEADLLVSGARHEAYGMAATEALAHGVPVLATAVGGTVEAVGAGGVLVPSDDPDALAAELRRWLTDASAREELRAAAAGRRTSLRSWADTARDLEVVLR
ncbi:glycosyltransferase family 4 protein [Nocardioides sp. MH1]|uniref:glycosyltransferase family 4 protein n=1 Tax=Nocardioides sp. MH1 TaxID=3242490 RepID=UPI00351FF08B